MPMRQASEEVTTRPLLTFALFSYNQEQYVRGAVEAALSQTYSPLEIILSDDASTDRTFEIMCETVAAYTGPHRVTCSKNIKNLGIAQHVDIVCRRATGELIVIAAADDIAVPHRAETLYRCWVSNTPRASALYSNGTRITDEGKEIGDLVSGERRSFERFLNPYIESFRYAGCSAAYTPDVFCHFPKMHHDLMGEDAILFRRAHLLAGVAYTPSKLVRYRVSQGVSSFIDLERSAYFRKGVRWAEERLLQRTQFIEDFRSRHPSGQDILSLLDRQRSALERQLAILRKSLWMSASLLPLVLLERVSPWPLKKEVLKLYLIRLLLLLCRSSPLQGSAWTQHRR